MQKSYENERKECAGFFFFEDAELEALLDLPVADAVASASKKLFDVQAMLENNQVGGLIGSPEEILLFDSPVKLENMKHGEAFNTIQKHMWAAVEKEMASDMPKTHQGQVVKNDIQKTKMIEAAIQGQKLKELADDLQTEVKALSKSTREEMSACKKVSLSNLITLNVYWKDITNDLVGIQSENDYKWQGVLRTYFDGKVVFKSLMA